MAKKVSPLRQRMINDMTMRNMSPNTQKIYVSAVSLRKRTADIVLDMPTPICILAP